MMLTNLNAISQYERMRRRVRPIVADIEDVGTTESSETVEDEDGTRGLSIARRPGEAARRRFRRRRVLLAPERRRWPRHNENGSKRELGRVVDTTA
ncbi:MAG: hypothetical protein KAU31_09580 [Spirochaetaceae bacterium]|nr:hypothetical protein [Spirochaetaceae bacterium]